MWKRYAKQVQVILQGLSVSALTVRDVQDSTLIADYPKDAVRSADIIRKERVVRINPSASHASATLALQFANDSVINAFIQELNWCVVKEITTTMAEPSFKMPDLQDSSVQDLILNLLFDASFTDFVSDLSMVVDNFKEMLGEFPRMAVEEKECIEQEGSLDEFGEGW